MIGRFLKNPPLAQLLLTLIISVSAVFTALSQDAVETGEYMPMNHIVDGDTLLYRIMYPLDFDRSRTYPLVIFLHGAGERGSNNAAQLIHGSRLFRDSIEKYPAVVIFPQCPREDYWANVDVERNDAGRRQFRFRAEGEPTLPLALVMDLMNTTINQQYIDADRVYLAGLSMGGMGTWELLWRMPDALAVAMPICGGGAPQMAKKMIDVPIWAFHGANDDVVPPWHSINMIRAVQEAGGRAKVTIYPSANHNSWDPAFAEPDYLSWMFSHSRN